MSGAVSGAAIVARMAAISSTGELVEYSRLLGIPPTTMSNWKNRDSCPKCDDMVRVARFKGVSLEWLVTGEGSRFPQGGADLSDEAIELAADIARLPAEYRDILRQNVEAYKALCFKLEKESSQGIG